MAKSLIAPFIVVFALVLCVAKLSGQGLPFPGPGIGPFQAIATSYANAGGSGDRTATIAVTLGGYTLAGGTINNSVDGSFANDANGSWWWNAVAAAGGTLTFDFGTSKYIDEIKFYQNDTTSHGTHKFQHSPDNSAWTDASSNFTLGGATTTVITITNPQTRRYWRMLGISGSVSNVSFQQETEFKIQ